MFVTRAATKHAGKQLIVVVDRRATVASLPHPCRHHRPRGYSSSGSGSSKVHVATSSCLPVGSRDCVYSMASAVAGAAAGAAKRRVASGTAKHSHVFPHMKMSGRHFCSAATTSYICVACGASHVKWQGQCSGCSEWNSLEEVVRRPSSGGGARRGGMGSASSSSSSRGGWVSPLSAGSEQPRSLSDVTTQALPRWSLADTELNRVLGGGVVPGSVTLISGDPGIGKSTLVMQLAHELAQGTTGPGDDNGGSGSGGSGGGSGTVMYVSGEETTNQLKSRADRLKIPSSTNVTLWNQSSVEEIVQTIHQQHARAGAADLHNNSSKDKRQRGADGSLSPGLRAVIIDSIQTMQTELSSASMGSITQVREAASMLLACAKSTGIPMFLVGHVNKAGAVAGPKVLEHLVDAVFYLEGESFQSFRLLRVIKNRFGASSEVAVYDMHEEGLQPVSNPALHFLRSATADDASAAVGLPPHDSGSAITASLEGTRVLMLEIQALATRCFPQLPPRHRSIGIDQNRFAMVCSVLQKHLRVETWKYDILANVVGGLTPKEPASDLATAMAIYSSYLQTEPTSSTVAIGEVGLAGEVRPVSALERRVLECSMLGFQRVIIPRVKDFKQRPSGCEVIMVGSVAEAARHCGLSS